jgi:hypothetical protein
MNMFIWVAHSRWSEYRGTGGAVQAIAWPAYAHCPGGGRWLVYRGWGKGVWTMGGLAARLVLQFWSWYNPCRIFSQCPPTQETVGKQWKHGGQEPGALAHWATNLFTGGGRSGHAGTFPHLSLIPYSYCGTGGGRLSRAGEGRIIMWVKGGGAWIGTRFQIWYGKRGGEGQNTSNLGPGWTEIAPHAKEGFQVSKRESGTGKGSPGKGELPRGLSHVPPIQCQPCTYRVNCVYVC